MPGSPIGIVVVVTLLFTFAYNVYHEEDNFYYLVTAFLMGWFVRDVMEGLEGSASSYSGGYTELDHKVLNLARTETPWMNLGKWKGGSSGKTYAEACGDLARAVGDAADLRRRDVLLDVGFGRGAQLLVWSQDYNVKEICGVNISHAEVEHAKHLVMSARTKSRFDLRVGDATRLTWREEHFDRVLAMDCAYHFVTRETFFQEARRVLRNGGKIVLADMILKTEPRGVLQRLMIRLICALSGIPRENLGTLNAYVDSLKRNDFEDVRVIEHFDVGSGFYKFMVRHEKEWGDVIRPNRMASLRRAAWFISKCPIEMCIISAVRRIK